MKTYQPIMSTSITAAAAVSKHLFAGFDGNVCGTGAKALGVFEADTAAGAQAPVVTHGIALVISGAAVSVGAAVTADAEGKAVTVAAVTVTVPSGSTPVTSDAAQPTLVVAGGALPVAVNGYAMDEASDAGEIIRIKLA